MRLTLILILSLAFVILVSGCAPQEVAVEPEAAPTPAPQPEPVAEPEVQITLTLISAPSLAEVGEQISFTWRVEGAQKTIPHTAVHYDYTSHPGTYGTDVAPPASGYPELTPDFASGEFQIPRSFSVGITPDQTGTLYYRLHAIVDGKNYWANERSISVAEPAPVIGVKEFTIEGDDGKLYPSSIEVSKGDLVRITFKVREEQVYFGGLDFRSDYWDNTGKVPKGGTATVEFTADKTFQFKSYWPVSNKLRATGTVIVS